MPPVYEIRTYQLNKFLEFETVLGENIRRFTPSDDNSDAGQLLRKPLFPKARVQPIILTDLKKDTMVILALRENHYLINTTFSTADLSKEVLYDPQKNNLNYLFFNHTLQSLTIKPRIEEDKIGALKYLGENLEDNLIRETILGFINLPKVPKDTVKRLRLERAENTIIYEGDTYAIKYRSRQPLRLNDQPSVRDLVYIIKEKVNTKNIAELWCFLRGKSVIIENDDALSNIIRNTDRLLTKIKKIEDKLNIAKAERFSTFVKNYINFDPVAISISYEAPEEIRWEIDIPDNLHN